MRRYLLLVIATCCHAAPLWTHDTVHDFWSAWLPTPQGMCWAVAYSTPTDESCRVQVTDRSVQPGAVIAPETVTAITGTLTNTSDATMYAVWFDGTLTLAPHESYTGVIGTIYGRWTDRFRSGGGINKDVGWINFSEIPGAAYQESVSIYTYDEAQSFIYEAPEPATWALTLAAIACARARSFARYVRRRT